MHVAFDPIKAYRRLLGIKGPRRRVAPALDPDHTPNAPVGNPLEIQQRLKQ